MFIGHSWVCFNGQMPLRALLWDENIMSGIITRLSGQDWNWWVTSLEIDEKISYCVMIQGFIFLFFAALSLIPIRKKSYRYIYLVSVINLVFLAFLQILGQPDRNRKSAGTCNSIHLSFGPFPFHCQRRFQQIYRTVSQSQRRINFYISWIVRN